MLETVGIATRARVEGGEEVIVGGGAGESVAEEEGLVVLPVAAGLVGSEVSGDGLCCCGKTERRVSQHGSKIIAAGNTLLAYEAVASCSVCNVFDRHCAVFLGRG
jgi:hypothetical protein